MNEYAIFCTVEMMLLIDADSEQEAREKAAKTEFSAWDCSVSAKSFNIELLGEGDELDGETEEEKRRYLEKEQNINSGDYATESHGE